jgi:rare lipoprotein A
MFKIALFGLCMSMTQVVWAQQILVNTGDESGILEIIEVKQMPKKLEMARIDQDLSNKINKTSDDQVPQNELLHNHNPYQDEVVQTSVEKKFTDPNRGNFYEGKEILGKVTYYKRGKYAANGERFNFNALTAAHAFLPFNTIVKVTNLRNQKSVNVRITDRCAPRFKIIDLAMGAAKQINMIRSGVINGKMEIVKMGDGKTYYHQHKRQKKANKSKKIKMLAVQ